MLQICIPSEKSDHITSKLLIDWQTETVGFTIIPPDQKKIHFSIDEKEWDSLKQFIDNEIKVSKDFDNDR